MNATTKLFHTITASLLCTVALAACSGPDDEVVDGTATLDPDAIERIQQAMDAIEDQVEEVTIDRDALLDAIEALEAADQDPAGAKQTQPLASDDPAHEPPSEPTFKPRGPGPTPAPPPGYRAPLPGAAPDHDDGLDLSPPAEPLTIVLPAVHAPELGPQIDELASCLNVCVQDYLQCAITQGPEGAELCEDYLHDCQAGCS